MNRFLIETIIDRYCYHKAKSSILVGIVTYYGGYIDCECLIFSSEIDIWKYVVKQIKNKSNLNIYNELINKCCKNRSDYEEIISRIKTLEIISRINSSFSTLLFMYGNSCHSFIEIIKINNNNLIYHRIRTEIYKILLGKISMKICKNITLFVHDELRCKYIDNDDICKNDYIRKNYIAKNISTDDIRI